MPLIKIKEDIRLFVEMALNEINMLLQLLFMRASIFIDVQSRGEYPRYAKKK